MNLPKISLPFLSKGNSGGQGAVRVPIQVNLVPDVKQQLLDAQRKRNFVITVAAIASVASVGLLLLLVIYTFVYQNLRMGDLRNRIDKSYEQFTAIPGVQDLVTIQNQVNLLNTDHQAKPITSRLFTLIAAIVPKGSTVKFSKISYDDASNSITLEGQTPNYSDYEKLSKTIERTSLEYPDDDDQPVTERITDRVGLVNAIAYSNDSAGQKITLFTIRFIVNENLFANQFHDKDDPSKQRLVIKAPDKSMNVTDSNVGIEGMLVERTPEQIENDKQNENEEAN